MHFTRKLAPRAMSLLDRGWLLFAWVFLPEGYPDSVSRDYLQYQLWDTLQGFLQYLRGIILGFATSREWE